MGRQSSRVFWNSKDHKDVFWGKYTKAVYIGSQLIWEKLADEYKYKYLNFNIVSYAIHNNETYIIATADKYDANTGNKVEDLAYPYLCRFNKTKTQIEVVKQLTSGYRYILTATPYGLAICKYSDSGNVDDAYIIDYDFTKDTSETKITDGTLEHPANIRKGSYTYVYDSDGIVEAASSDGLLTDENGDYYRFVGISKKGFYGDQKETIMYDRKMSANDFSFDAFYFGSRYITLQKARSSDSTILISTSDFKESIGVSLSGSSDLEGQTAIPKNGLLIHDNVAYIAGYKKNDPSASIEIFSYDGTTFKIAKTLCNMTDMYVGLEINYIDGAFFVFFKNKTKYSSLFFAGKSIEGLEKVEYSYPYGGWISYGCPFSDDNYFYVSAVPNETYYYDDKNYLKMDRDTLKPIERVEIKEVSKG